MISIAPHLALSAAHMSHVAGTAASSAASEVQTQVSTWRLYDVVYFWVFISLFVAFVICVFINIDKQKIARGIEKARDKISDAHAIEEHAKWMGDRDNRAIRTIEWLNGPLLGTNSFNMTLLEWMKMSYPGFVMAGDERIEKWRFHLFDMWGLDHEGRAERKNTIEAGLLGYAKDRGIKLRTHICVADSIAILYQVPGEEMDSYVCTTKSLRPNLREYGAALHASIDKPEGGVNL